MDTLQAILLGIVQGITEFLPVSSSGHLQIAKEVLGVELENNITFDVIFSDRTRCIRRLRGLPELPKAVRVCLVTIIRFWNFREPVSFSWF